MRTVMSRGKIAFCIPKYHPNITYRPSVAGAAKIRMLKYSKTNPCWCGITFINSILNVERGMNNINNNPLIIRDINKDRIRIRLISTVFPAPKYWAVIPVVPILRNPKFQYMKLNIIALIPTDPRWSTDKCPIRAVSTVESSGIDILLNIFGTASRRISLLIFNWNYSQHS